MINIPKDHREIPKVVFVAISGIRTDYIVSRSLEHVWVYHNAKARIGCIINMGYNFPLIIIIPWGVAYQ